MTKEMFNILTHQGKANKMPLLFHLMSEWPWSVEQKRAYADTLVSIQGKGNLFLFVRMHILTTKMENSVTLSWEPG